MCFEFVLFLQQLSNLEVRAQNPGAMGPSDVRNRSVAKTAKTAVKSKAQKSEPKEKAAKEPKASKETQDAKALKAEQSGMVTHWKKSPLQSCKDALAHYQQLSRFAPEKKDMLLSFKKDKKCQWFKDWVQTKSKSSSKTSGGVEGHATLCISQLCVKHIAMNTMLCAVLLCLKLFFCAKV